MENDPREGLKILRTMFPTCDINTIKSILASNHGQVERTIEDLLKISPQEVQANQPHDDFDDNLFADPKFGTKEDPVDDIDQDICEEQLDGVKIYYEVDFTKRNELQAKEFQMKTDSEFASELYKEELKKDKELYLKSQSWFGFKSDNKDDNGEKKPSLVKKMTSSMKNLFQKKTSAPGSPQTVNLNPEKKLSEEIESCDPKPMELHEIDIDKSLEIFRNASAKQIKEPLTPVDMLAKSEKDIEIFSSAKSNELNKSKPSQLEVIEKSFEFFQGEVLMQVIEPKRLQNGVYQPLLAENNKEQEESGYDMNNYSVVSEKLSRRGIAPQRSREFLRLEDLKKVSHGNNDINGEDDVSISSSDRKMYFQIRI